MLAPAQRDRIAAAASQGGVPISLTLSRASPPTALCRTLEALAQQISDETDGAVQLRTKAVKNLPALPALSVGQGPWQRVHYLAVPEGPEAGPFAELLLACAERGGGAGRVAERATTPNLRASLLVFVTSTCPHCPQTVRAAMALALDNSGLDVTVVDAQRFPELASRFGVRSVPVTVIDQGLALVGIVSASALEQRLLERGSHSYALERFKSLLETGRAERAAAELRSGTGAQLLVEAWRSSSTATRIGLLLAAEMALEQDAACLRDIAKALLPSTESEDPALRGDTADLLGRIGHPCARAALRVLGQDPNPDVAEIAAEALEALDSIH